MVNPCLQRSYKIKAARSAINSQVDIQRLPTGNGCYRPLKECIINAIKAEVIGMYMYSNNNNNSIAQG